MAAGLHQAPEQRQDLRVGFAVAEHFASCEISSLVPERGNASRVSPLRLARSPEYRLCGRSLRMAMPRAFFCPTTATSFLPHVIPV